MSASGDAPAARCLELLRARGETLATAESLTAGLVSATVASVPGASDVLRGGLVAYATDVKVSMLGVDAETLAEHGAVSAECARAMASGACAAFGSTWSVSTTGVAGPTEQEDQPVGTVYVAVAGRGGVHVRHLHLSGSRQEIREAAAVAGLTLLTSTLLAAGP